MYSCLSGPWTGVALLTFPLWANFYAAGAQQADERTIRSMVEQAIARLNRGDATAFDDFWAEDSDYVGVDGTLTKGRLQIQTLPQDESIRHGAADRGR